MGCIFPTFYESPSAAPVPRSHFAYVELQNCTKTAFTMAGKKARKNLAKNPFCTSHNPNFLNNWSARLGNTVCKNGCVKRVQQSTYGLLFFALQRCNVMSHQNPSLLWCISSFCILLFATQQSLLKISSRSNRVERKWRRNFLCVSSLFSLKILIVDISM